MFDRIAQLRRDERGFTLIELLVVVAIIALLATFAVPKLFEAINKSKKAPGDADMNTLSSALERYYFDNNAYPIDATPTGGMDADVMNGLKGGFVKANTTFLNGFKKGYVYLTDSTGSFYILVDPQGNSGNFTVECGNATTTVWTSSALTAGTAFAASQQTSAPGADDLNVGCSVKSTVTGFDVSKTTVITN